MQSIKKQFGNKLKNYTVCKITFYDKTILMQYNYKL